MKTQDLESAPSTKGLELEVRNERGAQEERGESPAEKEPAGAGAALEPWPRPPCSGAGTWPPLGPASRRRARPFSASWRGCAQSSRRSGRHDQMFSGRSTSGWCGRRRRSSDPKYQKQLQQSYLAMYQRNQRLEKVPLQQLARGDGVGSPLRSTLKGLG